MDERAALIAAIRQDPDDDLRHLVYADWLEETGNPVLAARAQLIRAQCLQRQSKSAREQMAAFNTERQILARLGWAWGPSHGEALTVMGFHGGLTRYRLRAVTLGKVVERAEDYHYALPPEAVLEVDATVSGKTDLAPLAGAVFAERVTGLRLDFRGYSFTPATLTKLSGRIADQIAAGPWPGPLNELTFLGGAFTGAEVRTLAASEPLRGLIKLEFIGGAGDGAAEALATAALWPRLRSLCVYDTPIPAGLRRRLADRYPGRVFRTEY